MTARLFTHTVVVIRKLGCGAAVHSGLACVLANRVSRKTIGEYGFVIFLNPSVVGPAISQQHFEVGEGGFKAACAEFPQAFIKSPAL